MLRSMNYNIIRPPLAESYKLPTKQELLQLKVGDLAKVTLQVGNDRPERMWVILENCTDPDRWSGVVDNDATQPQTAKALPAGTIVSFHPLDIIAIE